MVQAGGWRGLGKPGNCHGLGERFWDHNTALPQVTHPRSMQEMENAGCFVSKCANSKRGSMAVPLRDPIPADYCVLVLTPNPKGQAPCHVSPFPAPGPIQCRSPHWTSSPWVLGHVNLAVSGLKWHSQDLTALEIERMAPGSWPGQPSLLQLKQCKKHWVYPTATKAAFPQCQGKGHNCALDHRHTSVQTEAEQKQVNRIHCYLMQPECLKHFASVASSNGNRFRHCTVTAVCLLCFEGMCLSSHTSGSMEKDASLNRDKSGVF